MQEKWNSGAVKTVSICAWSRKRKNITVKNKNSIICVNKEKKLNKQINENGQAQKVIKKWPGRA